MPVWSTKFTIRPSAPGSVVGAGLTQRIRDRFAAQAGPLIVSAVQSVLGQDSIYTLSPGYAARKRSLPQFRRIAGKASLQPLILSADLYSGLRFVMQGDTLMVDVDPAHGVAADGFDVAEHWEQVTQYLEIGFDLVQDRLDEILCDVIVAEMLL